MFPSRVLVVAATLAAGLFHAACSGNALSPDGSPADGGADTVGDTLLPPADQDRTDTRRRDIYIVDNETGPDGVIGPDGGSTLIGGPCTSSASCLIGGQCLRQLPGGYCTLGCDVETPDSCDPGQECVPGGFRGGVCAQNCTPGEDSCREGYTCANYFQNRPTQNPVCAAGSLDAAFGDPCTSIADCPAGRGRCLTEATDLFPAGYCTGFCDPEEADACGAGATCIPSTRDRQNRLGGVCAPTCAGDGDCRTGYVCGNALRADPSSTPVCTPGDPAAVTGDPCANLGDCRPGDGLCALRAGALPGGYCTRACDPLNTASCGTGEECNVALAANGSTAGRCLKTCSGDGECRSSYLCVSGFDSTPTTSTVCAPGVATPVAIGSRCVDDGQCQAGTELCASGTNGYFAEGYCTAECDATTSGAACGGNGLCLASDASEPALTGLCLAGCTADGDCATVRAGGTATYGCSATFNQTPIAGGGKVCLPFKAGAETGDACETAGDCQLDGFCIGPASGSPFFSAGYCSRNCNANDADSCGEGNVCVAQAQDGSGFCVAGCTGNPNCRTDDGYSCTEVDQNGTLGCLPGDEGGGLF